MIMKYSKIIVLSLFFTVTLGSCNFAKGNRRPLIGGITNYKGQTEQTVDSTENEIAGLEIPAKMSGAPEQILHRTAYTTSYNSSTLLPNWVAWQLTSDHVTGDFARKGISFHEDEDVPSPRAISRDYSHSGYDRGHMCPSGDNKWNGTAQKESFLMTNICPQVHKLNMGDWNNLEEQCRYWAGEFGDIYIVAGPLFSGNKHKTIGEDQVTVPDAFFKVVLCMNGEPAAIGFIYDNNEQHNSMDYYAVTVDEVEKATGIDFFPALPDNIENKVEATVSSRFDMK